MSLKVDDQTLGRSVLSTMSQNSSGSLSQKRTELTAAQDAATGAVAGVVEIMLTMPFAYMQFSLQGGYQRPAFGQLFKNPLVWWSGFGSLAPGNAGIVLSQFLAEGFLTKNLKSFRRQDELTSLQQVAVAATAGAFSSLVNGPADLLTIYQQKNPGLSMPAAFKDCGQKYGYSRIYRGVTLCMVREGAYMCGYAGLAPQVKQYLKKDRNISEIPAHLGSSILCGALMGFMSQPFDVMIHMLQSDINKSKYPKHLDAWKEVWQKGGVTAYWLGFRWRVMRNMTGTCTMLAFKELAEMVFLHHD
jgi:hypothetical protein